MDNKNDFTIEELKKMHEDLLKETNTIGEMLRQKVQDEEDHKKAQLALEKEERKKELDDAINHAHELLQKWFKDYGSYGYLSNANNSLIDFLWPSLF